MFSKKLKQIVSAILLALLFSLILAKSRFNGFLTSYSIGYESPGTLNSSLYQQQLSLSHRVSTPNSANVTSTLLDGPESVGPACTSLYGGIDRDCCTLPNCWEHLTEFDRGCVKWCSNKAFVNRTEVMAGECRFMRGEGRAPIVLASLPGSGNTWIRGLLEKVTGICTGSIYCDVNLRRVMFNGEGLRSDRVLVVKTHRPRFTWTAIDKPEILQLDQIDRYVQPKFGAGILLLRNPYHAMVAEWNRQKCEKVPKPSDAKEAIATHIGITDEQHFGENPEWNTFVQNLMQNWINFVKGIILDSPPDTPKLAMRYEDFQRDRVREVSRMLDFLHFPYSGETLSQRLEEDFSAFHRTRHVEFEAFTQSQEEFIEDSLRQILSRLSSENHGDTLGIEEYLRHPL